MAHQNTGFAGNVRPTKGLTVDEHLTDDAAAGPAHQPQYIQQPHHAGHKGTISSLRNSLCDLIGKYVTTNFQYVPDHALRNSKLSTAGRFFTYS